MLVKGPTKCIAGPSIGARVFPLPDSSNLFSFLLFKDSSFRFFLFSLSVGVRAPLTFFAPFLLIAALMQLAPLPASLLAPGRLLLVPSACNTPPVAVASLSSRAPFPATLFFLNYAELFAPILEQLLLVLSDGNTPPVVASFSPRAPFSASP